MKSPYILLAAAILLVSAHALGICFGWYETTGWYDTFTHFLGGVWVALALFHFLKLKKVPLLIAALAAFLLWEGFEFLLAAYIRHAYGVSVGLQPGALDTISDIVAGTAGAMTASLSDVFAEKS